MDDFTRVIDQAGDADASARLAYYRLRLQPFRETADPQFLWLNEQQRAILAAMQAGVRDNAGLVLLTGDVGTGKTTLAHALEASLGEGVSVARLDYPGLDPPDFYRVVATAYGLGETVSLREMFLERLVDFLTQARAHDRRALLILDEAQSLSRELLAEVGHLAGLERDGAHLLNILLVGQDELGAIVLGPQHRELRHRMSARYGIDPLTPPEVDEYIRHRLHVAGAPGNPFDAGAIRDIATLSRGIPRLINQIADLALLHGFRANARTITASIVAECVRELAPREQGGRAWRRRRYAVAGAGPRRAVALGRHRGAVAAVAMLAIAGVAGGYLYAHGGLGARRDGSAPTAPRSGAEPDLPHPEADPAAPAIATSPPTAVTPDRETTLPAPVPPSRPASPGSTAKPAGPSRAADDGAKSAGARHAVDAEAKPASASRAASAQSATAPPVSPPPEETGGGGPKSDSAATSAPRPRVVPPADGAGARAPNEPDPGAIIDWLLRESPARRE